MDWSLWYSRNLTSSNRQLNELDDSIQETTDRVEAVNNRIEAIKGLVDRLKIMAEELKQNATAIKELDVTGLCVLIIKGKERKGKEEYLYIYSAILADTPLTKRSDMDHTVLPANYTMSAFPCLLVSCLVTLRPPCKIFLAAPGTDPEFLVSDTGQIFF